MKVSILICPMLGRLRSACAAGRCRSRSRTLSVLTVDTCEAIDPVCEAGLAGGLEALRCGVFLLGSAGLALGAAFLAFLSGAAGGSDLGVTGMLRSDASTSSSSSSSNSSYESSPSSSEGGSGGSGWVLRPRGLSGFLLSPLSSLDGGFLSDFGSFFVLGGVLGAGGSFGPLP